MYPILIVVSVVQWPVVGNVMDEMAHHCEARVATHVIARAVSCCSPMYTSSLLFTPMVPQNICLLMLRILRTEKHTRLVILCFSSLCVGIGSKKLGMRSGSVEKHVESSPAYLYID